MFSGCKLKVTTLILSFGLQITEVTVHGRGLDVKGAAVTCDTV